MDDLVPPVVATKPARGREMQTTTIPTDMFDTMRIVSAKKTLGGEDLSTELKKPTDGTAEYYHEGYVDGKLYLVPDSNLDAMRDIINFKMRPRRSTRYKHQTSYEISDYDHFRGKLDGLFTKLDNIQDLHSNLSGEDIRELEEEPWKPEERLQKKLGRKPEKELKDKYKDQVSEYESEDEEDSEEKSEIEDSEEKSEDSESKEELKQKSNAKFEDESDIHYLRFLVSGHFKKDQKPIYIIQEYNGEPDVFKNQKADFFSKQKDGNVDVFISGKFYNDNMLEESDGKPVSLMTKPVKIKIEMGKSKIYYDYFKDIYNMKNFDISFKGEFIKSKVTNRITPFLTLGIEKRTTNQKLLKSPNHESKNQQSYSKNMTPATVLVYKPKYYTNPFSHYEKDIHNEDTDNISIKEYLYPKKIHEPLTEMDPRLNNSSQQVATHYYSLSNMGEEFLGVGVVNEPTNKPLNRPYKPPSNQSNTVSMKEPAEAVPVSGETASSQNTPNPNNSLKEGFLKTLLKGSSLLKTLFEKKPSKDSFEINKNTQKTYVKSTQSTTNIQLTPTTEKKSLEKNKENTPKNKIRSIFHVFK